MILVFSDIHFGRLPEKDPFLSQQLLACIKSYGDGLDQVIFLGDVFESFMEYKRSVDAEAELLVPVLNCLASQHAGVSYLVGNHDPWHLDYFSNVHGVGPLSSPLDLTVGDRTIYFSHGDEEDHRSWVASITRYFMRTPFYYRLYRFIPYQAGQRLPRWISRKFTSPNPNPRTIHSLNEAALRILNTGASNTVVFGHAHQQSRVEHKSGNYFNTGSWFLDLSYLEIGPNKIEMRKWQPVGQ